MTHCLVFLLTWVAQIGWFMWLEKYIYIYTAGIWIFSLALRSDSWVSVGLSLSTESPAYGLYGLEMQARKYCGFHIKNFLSHFIIVKAET